jgi:hypothetical protein
MGNRLSVAVTAVTRQWQVRMIAFPVENSQVAGRFRLSDFEANRLKTFGQEEM